MDWTSNDYNGMNDFSDADWNNSVNEWTDNVYTPNANANGGIYDSNWTMPSDMNFNMSNWSYDDATSGQWKLGDSSLSNLMDGYAGGGGNVQDWRQGFTESNQPSNIDSTMQYIKQALSNPQLLTKGLSSLFEMQANKKRAAATDPMALLRKLQGALPTDPTKQMRDQAQNQFIQATQDPNSIPIVRQQQDAAMEQMMRQARAGGRPMPQISTAMQGQNAKIAQDYINSMAQFRVNPENSTLASLFGQANTENAKYGSLGPAPIFSAVSNALESQQNQENTNRYIEAIRSMGK